MTRALLIGALALLPLLARSESDISSPFSEAAGGAVLAKSGDLEGAAKAADEALRRYEASEGPGHPLTVAARRNAGVVSWHQGLFAKAEAALVQALGASLALGADGAPKALEIQLDLAGLFAGSDRPALADALFETVLDKAGPELALEAAHLYARFAASHPAASRVRNRARASALIKAELNSRKQSDAVSLAPLLAEQACLALSDGDREAAAKLWAQALPGLERFTGLLTYGSLPAHEAYAFALYQTGDLSLARVVYTKTLAFRKKTLGATHPETLALESFLKKIQSPALKTSPAP